LTAGRGLEDKVYCLQAQSEQRGQRLDVYLASVLGPDISRSRLQYLIEVGQVQVKGKTAKAALKLTGNEQIIVQVPPQKPLKVVAEDRPLNIVFEDDYLLLINKPAGVVVHPAPGHRQGTLVNALLAHCKENLSDIGGILRPGIVHRLDKDTSGLLVVAKSEDAYHGLIAALKSRAVKRKYLCLVQDQVKPDQSTVDAPIGRHPKVRLKMAVVPDGRSARTYFTVLERLGDYTFLQATLETGRTHQIRVHAAFIGHPIVGDPLYGRRQGNLGLKRQFLHAAELGFTHPVTKEELKFNSSLPEDLNSVLERLRVRS
jgi:23S rRNA pseudouridine1911/1915/1917 synthase